MVMYTKKEMAELLGVSKSTVYRFIQENGINFPITNTLTIINKLRTIMN
ncbi:helix-turn-helix domain-containing protein [Limosilactobacillus coleohominis]